MNRIDITQEWRVVCKEHMPWAAGFVDASTRISGLWWELRDCIAHSGEEAPAAGIVESVFEFAWWSFALSGNDDLVAAAEWHFYSEVAYYNELKALVALHVRPWQFLRLEHCMSERYFDIHYRQFRNEYFNTVFARLSVAAV